LALRERGHLHAAGPRPGALRTAAPEGRRGQLRAGLPVHVPRRPPGRRRPVRGGDAAEAVGPALGGVRQAAGRGVGGEGGVAESWSTDVRDLYSMTPPYSSTPHGAEGLIHESFASGQRLNPTSESSWNGSHEATRRRTWTRRPGATSWCRSGG